jgi:hypothetical protein
MYLVHSLKDRKTERQERHERQERQEGQERQQRQESQERQERQERIWFYLMVPISGTHFIETCNEHVLDSLGIDIDFY